MFEEWSTLLLLVRVQVLQLAEKHGCLTEGHIIQPVPGAVHNS
jgi:hypothetical protein